MTLPTFLVIGAQKAGTTSLWEYLRRHPQVFMAQRKEVCFFVESYNWWRGLPWYEQQFEGAGDALAIGEACPGYAMHPLNPGVPGRIAGVIPDVQLIYILRHPIERMRSHYRHRILSGVERRPIERALRENPDYLNNTRYASQIDRFLEFFPRERMHILLAEQLRHERDATMRDLQVFLGIDPHWRSPSFDSEHNVSSVRDSQRSLVRWLLSMHVFRRRPFKIAAERLPGRVNRLVRWSTHNPPRTIDTSISRALEERLLDDLADDLERLTTYVPAALDTWGLREGARAPVDDTVRPKLPDA